MASSSTVAGSKTTLACTASALFAAAVRKEHIDVNDPRYKPGGIAAGQATVIDFKCASRWAYGLVGRPEAGTQDGGTLFRQEGDAWAEVSSYVIEDESACVLHTKFGVPVRVIDKLHDWARPCVTAPASGKSWTTYETYRNSLYGFSVDYPTEMIANMPSDSGRHMNFRSSDQRVALSVYAYNNSAGDTTQGLMAKFKTEMPVSYSQVLKDGFIISGADQSFITYERCFVYSNVVYVMRWDYPLAMKTQLDDAVTHSYQTFSPGPNRAK